MSIKCVFMYKIKKKENVYLDGNENVPPQIAFIWIQGGERSLPKLPLQTIVDFAQVQLILNFAHVSGI